MDIEAENSSILKVILIGAGASIIIFAMRASSSILSPFLLAGIIGISVLPATSWLIRRGVSTWLALLITKIRKNCPSDSPIFSRFRSLVRDLQQYVSITTWINFLVGLVNTVFLIILGVDFAVLWGLLSFLTGYIPNIGFWIALIPPFLLALLQFGIVKALIVLVGFVVINGGVQNFLQPKMMGQGLNLSVFVVTVSLFFWGWLLGPMGAILAIPLTMIVKEVFLDAYDDTRRLADLMSSADLTPEKIAPDVPAR